jgi:integrase
MAVKVRERKGAWWLFIDHNGKRKAKRVGPGKAGKRAAMAAADQIRARLVLGDLSCFDPRASATATPTVPTLGQLADDWLTRDVPLRCKGSTAQRYRRALATYWLPRFGDRLVTEVTRDEVKAALADLGASLSKTTIRYGVLPPFKGLLTYAVEQGHLVASPAA